MTREEAIEKMRAVASTFDRGAETYDSRFTATLERHEDIILASLVAPHIRGHVVDIGCGTGALLALGGIEPCDYTGVDISLGMLRKAVQKYPLHQFVRATADILPIQSATADSVISLYGAFSYVNRPKATVAEMARVLKLGGRVFIMACGLGYDTKTKYLRGLEDIRRLWTINRLRALFNWDFADVYVRSFSFGRLPALPLWIYKSLECALSLSTPHRASWLIVTATKRREYLPLEERP